MPCIRFFLILVLVSIRASASPGSTTATADPAELIGRTWAQYRTVASEREELTLLLVTNPHPAPYTRSEADGMAADSGVTVKHAVRHVVYDGSWQDRLHILFSSPREDVGLGFLLWRDSGGGADQAWLYMPGYYSVRRVSLGAKQRLAGTQFTYEDLRELAGERTQEFDYRTVATETLDGRSVQVVLAVPKTGTASIYRQRKLWIDSEWLFPVQAEFYEPSGRLWKQLRSSAIHEIAPGVRRADLIELRDVIAGQATLLVVTQRRFGEPIPARVFTQDYLEHPGKD